MRIDIPERDAPRWPVVGAIGVVALALGVGLAAWGTSTEPAASEEVGPSPQAPPPSPPEATDADEPPAEPEGEPDPEAEPEPDPEAEPEPDPEAEPEPEPPAEPEATADPDPTPPSGSLSVRRGRVAYLRCEQSSGPRCPRDEAMEEAVWSAIDDLLACPTAPRSAGRADLRLDFRGDAAPGVQWRDTFGDDVVRLDRDAVLSCLRDSLQSARAASAGERLLVSFRFRVE